jgi:hypothetical protein
LAYSSSRALGDVGSALFGFDARMEQTSTAFTSLLGSAAAQCQLRQLTAFAASTPFNLPDVENAARRLLAFGFSAQHIIPMLTAVGDAAMIDRVTLALG